MLFDFNEIISCFLAGKVSYYETFLWDFKLFAVTGLSFVISRFLAAYLSFEISCFWAVTRFSYEISRFLSLKRFHDIFFCDFMILRSL
jgi:hypothetical protein